MSKSDLTPEAIKQQHAESVAKGDTFETHGVSVQAAKAYLNTDEGALYWWRVAEMCPPDLSSHMIDNRAIGQLMSGLELPRMVTISPRRVPHQACRRGQKSYESFALLGP